MTPPRLEGTLKKWNADRGFGFIVARDDGKDIFVHTTAFPDDGYLPTVGEVLTYEVEPDRNGKRSAVRVQRFIDPAPVGALAAGRFKRIRLAKSSSASASASSSSPSSGPFASGRVQTLIVLLLLAALAVFAYSRYAKRVGYTGATSHQVK